MAFWIFRNEIIGILLMEKNYRSLEKKVILSKFINNDSQLKQHAVNVNIYNQISSKYS